MSFRQLFFSAMSVSVVFFVVVMVWGVVNEHKGKQQLVYKPSQKKNNEAPHARFIPLKYYYKHLRYIEGKLNGKDCKLLFTTGGGETILSPGLFAEHYGADTIGGIRLGKESLSFSKKYDLKLEVEGLVLEHEYALVKDVMNSLPEGFPKIDGIISMKAFGEHALTVDLRNRRLIVEDEKSMDKLAHRLVPLELRYLKAANEVGMSLLASLETAEGQMWFELDNGRKRNVLNFQKSLQVLENSEYFEKLEDKSKHTVSEIDVLGLCAKPASLAVKVEYQTIGDGVLGAHFFRDFMLTFDIKKGRLYCRPHVLSKFCNS